MGWFRRKRIADISKPVPLAELRRHAKIVVIDDEPDSFPADALRAEGYHIEQWTTVENLGRLESGDFDIIILDIAGVAKQITNEDGLGILEHLKKYNPAQIIIAFSGQSYDIEKTKFFTKADDVLAKPVEPLACKEVIDALLSERLTLAHYWQGFASVLAANGLSQKQISKLETKLARAIEGGDGRKAQRVLEGAADMAENAAAVVSLGKKILALVSLLC